MKTGKRNIVKNTDRRAHTCTCARAHTCTCARAHTCRNLLCGSDTVRSSEVRWFQTSITILAAVNMSSVFRWIGGRFLRPHSNKTSEIWGKGLLCHCDTTLGDRSVRCGGPWYAGRVTLVTASSGYGSKTKSRVSDCWWLWWGEVVPDNGKWRSYWSATLLWEHNHLHNTINTWQAVRAVRGWEVSRSSRGAFEGVWVQDGGA